MTATLERPVEAPPPQPEGEPRAVPTWAVVGGVVLVWIALAILLRGKDTQFLPGLGRTGFHDWFTELKSDLITSRDTNILMQVTGALSDAFNSTVDALQKLVSEPARPRPVPEVGWLGVVALAVWVTLAAASWRMAVFAGLAFLAFGYLGFWEDSMDTLIITFFSVGLALIVGIPLAVMIGVSRRANAIATPVLDLLQTLPAFAYLPIFTLFFSIGPACAVALTVVFCTPPVIRIAGHGIRAVSSTTIEATNSIGQTGWQRLRKVQLPMAKKTTIVGVNQTIMAALSMVVIAGYVNGPGLGKPVLQALAAEQVGRAFVAGLCIVILAVLLDRTTTVASERAERVARGGGGDPMGRRIVLGVVGLAALVMVYLSRTYLWAAEFPESDLGTTLAGWVDDGNDWVATNLSDVTTWVQNTTTNVLINPLQDLLAGSPWWLTAVAFVVLAGLLAGKWPMVTTVACLAGIFLTDLWYDSMVTLTSVLVATVVVMVLAVVFGVWMARNRAAEQVIRPILDAAQTMPAFVYLIPALALFGPNRFTAIVAAVVYAAPVAIKLVADGVKGVSETTIEAATSTGSSTWQIITKVQLPMARTSLVLAANQGLLFVLSMVVIGGLVGGGALGYDVVLGFSQGEYFGKGVAAGIAIVLLGVMLDRVARGAARHDTGFQAAWNLLRRYPRQQA